MASLYENFSQSSSSTRKFPRRLSLARMFTEECQSSLVFRHFTDEHGRTQPTIEHARFDINIMNADLAAVC